MRVEKSMASLELKGEEAGERLIVRYDNRGEPYREGVSLMLMKDYTTVADVWLEDPEAIQLRDLLNKMYPESGTAR